MKHSLGDQILALAGVFQGAGLVQQLAINGKADSIPMAISLRSLFVTDPHDVPSVYGDPSGVCLGLQCLSESFAPTRDPHHIQRNAYVVSLLHLANRLRRQAGRYAAIGEDLVLAEQQARRYGIHHANLMARLADIYQTHISPLGPRIMVRGDALHLENPHNANRVRALLLAGIRSAVLWQQCGGSRFGLLLHRRRLLNATRDSLARACPESG